MWNEEGKAPVDLAHECFVALSTVECLRLCGSGARLIVLAGCIESQLVL